MLRMFITKYKIKKDINTLNLDIIKTIMILNKEFKLYIAIYNNKEDKLNLIESRVFRFDILPNHGLITNVIGIATKEVVLYDDWLCE